MISGDRTEIQRAHIIPVKKGDWFLRNKMTMYCLEGPAKGIDDQLNKLTLRSDIHWIWDRSRFAIVPKHDTAGMACLTSHWLTQMPDMIDQYQNRATLIPQSHCRGEILFARFALQILDQVSPFFPKTMKRRIRISSLKGGFDIKDLARPDIPAFQPKSRSQSPKKRQLPQDSTDVEEQDRSFIGGECELSFGSSISSAGHDSASTPDDISYESPRGRKRRRSDELQDDGCFLF